jgi:hypothetical protein
MSYRKFISHFHTEREKYFSGRMALFVSGDRIVHEYFVRLPAAQHTNVRIFPLFLGWIVGYRTPILSVPLRPNRNSETILKSRKAQSHFLDATKFYFQRTNCRRLDHYPSPFLRHNGLLYQLHILFHYFLGLQFQLCTSSNFLSLTILSTHAHI